MRLDNSLKGIKTGKTRSNVEERASRDHELSNSRKQQAMRDSYTALIEQNIKSDNLKTLTNRFCP
jgi:uncharacterized protein YaiL (DUF2058 family)